jgi:hypothetical protein
VDVQRRGTSLTILSNSGKPMSQTKMQHTRSRLTRIYGIGIAIFTLGVGSITVIALFLAQLKMD